VSVHLRIDYKCNYEKIKENNNNNNNKYIWEVEFRGSKSREKYGSKVWVQWDGSLAGTRGPWGPIARSSQ
jgi:hypothetical protein